MGCTVHCRRFHPGTHAAYLPIGTVHTQASFQRSAVGMLHGIIQEARRGSGLDSTRSGYHLLDVTTQIARRSCALDSLEHAERPAVWEHFLQVQYPDGAGPGRTRRCMCVGSYNRRCFAWARGRMQPQSLGTMPLSPNASVITAQVLHTTNATYCTLQYCTVPPCSLSHRQ